MIIHFTIGATTVIFPARRKAWDLNPHDPKVARFSKPARQTVSGYLPFQWSHRESNPDCQPAALVSSRWTMAPSVAILVSEGREYGSD